MKKLVCLTVLFLAFAISAHAQTAQSDLDVANARLVKVLDALESAEKAIEAQKAEIASLKSLAEINNQLIIKKEEIISDQNKLIEKLEKQTRPELKILWGLFKVRF